MKLKDSQSFFFLAMFVFIISIANIGFAQPPCSDNPAPGNTVCEATPICNFDGYCGETYGTYTSDSWPELENAFAGCTDMGYDHGTIDNNSFLSFVADSNCVNFTVYVNNCDGFGTGGIQLMLFSAEYCDHGDVTCYDGSYEWKETGGPYTLSSCSLTPGETYYIMIDGYSGDVCDYTFEAVDGLSFGITADIGADTTICANESVTVTASGADDYLWSGDAGLSATSGSVVTVTPPSTPGTYDYSIEGTGSTSGGSAACPGTDEINFSIIVQEEGTPQFDSIEPICSGESLTLPGTSNGGIEGVWSPAFDNTTTTSYTFTPNNSGCATDTTLTVVVNSSIQSEFSNPGPICSGESFVLPTTSENGIDGSWSPIIDNTTTTDYTFIPDNDQCANDTTITVEVDAEITPSFSNPGPICEGDNFTLPTTSNNNISGTWSPAIDNTVTTTYTFTPDNGSGSGTCPVTTTTLEVEVNTIPAQPDVVTAPVSCSDPSESTVINYNPATTYTFNPTGPSINGNGVISGMTEGIDYTLLVDNGNCVSAESDTFNYTLNEEVTADFDSDIDNGCSPLNIQFQNLSTGETNYSWDFGDGSTSTDANPQHIYTQEGCYDVSLIVFNDHNCSDTLILHDKICVDPSPIASFDPAETNLSENDSEVHFNNTSTGGASYQWSFGDGGEASVEAPSHNYNTDEPNTYDVVLIVQNTEGCTDTATGLITVLPAEMHYQFPNVFTPNGDNQNDYFKLIDYKNISQIEILILNRWGNVVFTSNQVDFKWNGKIKNSGAKCDDGTYFYKATLTNLYEEEVKEHGFIQLSRSK